MGFKMSEKGPSLQAILLKPEAPTVSFAPSQAPANVSVPASASAASGAPPAAAAAAAAAAATSNGAAADPGNGRATEGEGLQVSRKQHHVELQC